MSGSEREPPTCKIPGDFGTHAVIRPLCRATHGTERAFELAVEKLRARYLELVPGKPAAAFHFLLTVQSR